MLSFDWRADALNFEDEFLQSLRKKTVREGTEGLMLAVLEDAVYCYKKYAGASSRKGQKLFSEAEEWIADQDSDWPFSFVNICEVLGLDPAYLRDGLMHWKAMKSQGHESGNIYSLPLRHNLARANSSLSPAGEEEPREKRRA